MPVLSGETQNQILIPLLERSAPEHVCGSLEKEKITGNKSQLSPMVLFPYTSCWVLNVSQPPTCILTLDRYTSSHVENWDEKEPSGALQSPSICYSHPFTIASVSIPLLRNCSAGAISLLCTFPGGFDCEITYCPVPVPFPWQQNAREDARKVFPTVVALLERSNWNWEGKTAQFTMQWDILAGHASSSREQLLFAGGCISELPSNRCQAEAEAEQWKHLC